MTFSSISLVTGTGFFTPVESSKGPLSYHVLVPMCTRLLTVIWTLELDLLEREVPLWLKLHTCSVTKESGSWTLDMLEFDMLELPLGIA